jgi:glycosyltransferase involved in cell wall biosynthesis
MKLVSWWPTFIHHFSHFNVALSRAPGVTLTTVVGRTREVIRERQGWKPEKPEMEVISLEGSDWWRRGCQVLDEHADAVHLFNTMWTDRRFLAFILRAAHRKIRIGLITEPYSDTVDGYFQDRSTMAGGILKAIRPPMYRVAGLALHRHMGPIFAISPKAVAQFGRAGFDSRWIYPFGYFVRPETEVTPAPVATPTLKLIYVGAMLTRKGVDVAVEAVRSCRKEGLAVELDLYGSGDPTPYVASGEAIFRGQIPVGRAGAVMAQYDALVLPSRYDGWGVVINEALQHGVPALASDNAGASALVRASGAGSVFRGGDPTSLAGEIARAARDPAIVRSWRERARAYGPRLHPDVAAAFLRDCVQSWEHQAPAPPCPWY